MSTLRTMVTTVDRPVDQDGSIRPSPVVHWRAAVAGMLAAGMALAVGELPSALAGESVSQVTAVGNEFVDRFAGSLRSLAVELFGTNDKAALVVGIVVVSLGLGAYVGVVAAGRFLRGVVAFAGFGVVGLGSAVSDPQLGPGVAIAGAVLAVGAGLATLAALLRIAGTRSRVEGEPSPTDSVVADPRVRTPDRRAFLAFSGLAGLTAVGVAGASRSLRGGSVSRVREQIALPPPRAATPIPATGIEVPGLSPFVTPNDDFYRIDTALTIPQVDPGGWRLRIDGFVDRPHELTYDDILAMDLVDEPVTLQCVSNEVGGPLVGNAVWRGVPLAAVLERAGVRAEGTQIVGRSVDGFTVGMPTDVALDGRTALLAVGMNGAPLPLRHGFPARLVVAGLYGYVSATKWLRQIELVGDGFDAYWVPRGWAKEAPIKLTSRIDVPRAGQRLPAGTHAVAGVAWAPNTGIERVEVRIAGAGRSDRAGEGWHEATLGRVPSNDTWVQWRYEWDAEPGQYEIAVRCTDRTGLVQTAERTGVAPNGATGHHTVALTVTA